MAKGFFVAKAAALHVMLSVPAPDYSETARNYSKSERIISDSVFARAKGLVI